MNSLFAELVSSCRLPRRSPGFAGTVIAVLALGVGANTAIFSVINAVLLHPFPYRDAGRIAFIGSSRVGKDGTMPVTYPDFLDFRGPSKSFESLAYAGNRTFTLTQVADPANLKGAVVSASVWPLLGIRPVTGRVFTEAEDRPGANPVCVLSATAWQGRFAGDPAIVGRQVMLDHEGYTVVGVMPPRFKFWDAEVWVPAGQFADTELMRSRIMRMNYWMVGRLRPGVSLQGAEGELNVIARRIEKEHPDSNRDIGVRVSLLSDSVTGPVREPLLLLLGAVGLVLLIACANVANLMLARNAARRREFAVRAALGAGRARLARQVVLESLPLAVLGSAAGILAGAWGLRSLVALLPTDAIPAEAQIAVSVPVMLCTLSACLGTMVLFSLIPAWDLFRTDLNAGMKEGGRGSDGPRASRVRSGLIIAELALSLILLAGAGLLIRSFARLAAVDPGFRADHLLVLSLQLPESRYRSAAQASQFVRDVLERVRRIPGVTVASSSNNIPFLGGMGIPLLVPGKTYTQLNALQGVQVSAVTEDYFAAQGLRLLAGRAFNAGDRAGAEPVIVLNEAAVKKFLAAGTLPLDQRVMLGIPANLMTPGLLPTGLDKFVWSRVVGVVNSSHFFSLDNLPTPAAYIPGGQNWDSPAVRGQMFLLIRTAGDPTRIGAQARGAVTAVDPDEPVSQIFAMDRVVEDSLRSSRFMMVLLSLFAAVASTLAAVGIYGVVAWSVARRTRELGIRAALGATRSDVVRLVLTQSMRVVLLGLLLGLGGALALARLLKSLLYETSVSDPWTFAAVALGLGVVGFLASFGPAIRASRISPLEAFRAE